MLLDPWYSIQIAYRGWKTWRLERRALAEDLRLRIENEKKLEDEKYKNEQEKEKAAQELNRLMEKRDVLIKDRLRAYKLLTGEAPLEDGCVQIDPKDPDFELRKNYLDTKRRLEIAQCIREASKESEMQLEDGLTRFREERNNILKLRMEGIKRLEEEQDEIHVRINKARDLTFKQSGLNLQRLSLIIIAMGVFTTAAFNTLTYFNITPRIPEQVIESINR